MSLKILFVLHVHTNTILEMVMLTIMDKASHLTALPALNSSSHLQHSQYIDQMHPAVMDLIKHLGLSFFFQ